MGPPMETPSKMETEREVGKISGVETADLEKKKKNGSGEANALVPPSPPAPNCYYSGLLVDSF